MFWFQNIAPILLLSSSPTSLIAGFSPAALLSSKFSYSFTPIIFAQFLQSNGATLSLPHHQSPVTLLPQYQPVALNLQAQPKSSLYDCEAAFPIHPWCEACLRQSISLGKPLALKE